MVGLNISSLSSQTDETVGHYETHTHTHRSLLTPPCFVVHTPLHNSLISQAHRRPTRNVLLWPPACVHMHVCVCQGRMTVDSWLGFSIWYTKNIIARWRAVCEIHTSRSQRGEAWAQRNTWDPVILYLRNGGGTGCTTGTTHTNTATRHIGYSGVHMRGSTPAAQESA